MDNEMTVEEFCMYCEAAGFQEFTYGQQDEFDEDSLSIIGSYADVIQTGKTALKFKSSNNSLAIKHIRKIVICLFEGLPIQEISVFCGIEKDIRRCDKYTFLAWE